MSTRPFHGFVFDDENEAKIHRHGISARQVAQLLDSEHVILRNRKRRRALRLVIGRDHGGRCIAVAVEPTVDPVVWRPVTAWYCKDHELARLRKL